MPHEELLREARILAFNLHRRAVLAESYRTGSDRMIKDLQRRLARVWNLLSWSKKNVPMDVLRRAVDIEWAAEQDMLASQRQVDTGQEVTGPRTWAEAVDHA